MPDAFLPCWVSKKLRPLPVYSCTEVTSTARKRRRRSASPMLIPAGSARPSPWIRSRYDNGSICGVRVWLRTKSRDCGVR
nr:hypothetical protein [Nocardioides sp. J9]